MNRQETQLQQSLSGLRSRLLLMAASVGIALDEACSALTDGNMGKAASVIDSDTAINDLELEIDDQALSILVRFQPVAKDLRFVVAAMRLVGELERIGDEAVSIAERVLIMQGEPPSRVLEATTPLARSARELYAWAVDSLKTEDLEKALSLCNMEDESTQQEVAALHRLMDALCPDSRQASRKTGDDGAPEEALRPVSGIHGILICRSLNRICRRSVNLAEQACFIVKGINIKHRAP